MSRALLLTWTSRVLVALVVVGASVVAGEQLRVAREGAAARSTSMPTALTSTGPSVAPRSVAPTVVPTLAAPTDPRGTAPSSQGPTSPQPTKFWQSLPTATPSPTPGAATTIAGRVTANGAPIAGAQIRVYKADQFANGPTPVPPDVGTATSAADGTYRLTVPGGTYRVGAWLDETVASGMGVHWATWHPSAYAIGLGTSVVVSGPTQNVDIAMLKAVKVSGRVLGRDGVGVPNAQVSTGKMFNVGYPIAGAVTDRSGAFSFSTVVMDVTFAVQAQGKAGAVWATRDIDVRGDLSGLVFTLDRGNIVSGTLRDASGHPIATTDFSVTDAAMACFCYSRTDASGRYSMVLASGQLQFRTTGANPGIVELISKPYAVDADMTLDVVLSKP
jgi:hypothetical protein